MDFSSSEISSTIFKRIVRDDIGNYPLDHQTLAVFMELDGKHLMVQWKFSNVISNDTFKNRRGYFA